MFNPGSIYQVSVNSSGSDLLRANGAAALNDGTVRVLAETGSYQPSTTYTILTAAGGVSGSFAGVSSNFAYLEPSLRYSANDVHLTLARKTEPQPEPPTPEPEPPTSQPERPAPPRPDPKPLPFHWVSVTPNQYNVANAVEALGSGNAVFDAIIGQSVSGARQAFVALSSEAHASVGTMAIGSASLVQNTLMSRMRGETMSSFAQVQGAYAADARGVAPEPVAIDLSTLDQRRFALWGDGFGSWGRSRSNGDAAGLDASTGGFILGADALVSDTLRLGVAGGFTRTSFDVDGRLSSGSNETVFGALYGSASWGRIRLRLGASYARHDIDTQRQVQFPGFRDQLGASYGGWTAHAFGELGYRVDLNGAQVEPFIGASVLRLHTDAFQEKGGAAALTGYARDQDLATTTLGLRAEARLSDTVPLIVRGLVGWRHAYGDVEPEALLAFSGGASAFTAAGTPIDRNALVVEAGLDWWIAPDMTLGVAYAGQIESHAQEHALKGSFTWRF
ncbi:autotransporter outer membrane beta-barrel domain-containing protein [Microvirga lotononidis]|uniref:Outer membrane autotransporter barrel domain-containing protein n=1 Tax=Microvirga lotononidis TaxID=864069 RepID=I4YXF9_9HYPH|nr:autotransporter domain-containing protein [Microvirga lotononidis]EIM28651.1 outer membrane autotransporter barrel domain-containing protein [Microvirga lotononidis]WQO25605.1 autotransporter domain-containing protein [Microvirga lotononidis]